MTIQQAMDTCLDVEAMRSHLRSALAPQGAVDSVRVLEARRSASKHRHPFPLVVMYEVDVRDTLGAAPRRLLCHGKVVRDVAAFDAEFGARADGTKAIRVDALDLRLWAWPDDPDLPQLPRLHEPAATGPWWGCDAAKVKTLRYKPGVRATIRYEHSDGRVLYAKTFATAFGVDKGKAIHRRFSWFWGRAAVDPRAPKVARPLGYVEADHCLWQEPAPGAPLGDLLDVAAHWPTAVAHAIDVLHAAPIELVGTRRHDTTHWLAEVERRRQKIGRADPALEARVDAVAASIVRAASRLAPRELSLIHGDFHHEQVWLDGERVVLFDFDEFTLGDPMEDLAEFIVKLPPRALDAGAGERFVDAYARVAPGRHHPAWLAWHVAVGQLLQTSRAFVFQVPDWRAEVQRRLARAEVGAATAESLAQSTRAST